MLSRRSFLVGGGVAAGTAVGGYAAWEMLLREHLDDRSTAVGSPASPATSGTSAGATTPSVSPGARSVVVVLALDGGNDALNTLVPLNDGLYHDYRSTLSVADGTAVGLTGSTAYGLSPVLAPLAALWDAGQLSTIAGVGFAEQSRSHFAALDTWWSGQPGAVRTTGWLGRWLDTQEDPTNPLTAVALGSSAPMLIGKRASSTVILDPTSFSLRAPRGADAAQLAAAFRATAGPSPSADPSGGGATLLDTARQAWPATLRGIDTFGPVLADDGNADEPGAGSDDGPNGSITALLKSAVRIIELDLGTRVIVVSAGGFDTHAGQAEQHADLLADVAAGIVAFHAALAESSRAHDVLLVTTSEFGRRVAENGSGTDHGKGGVSLLVGPMVAPRSIAGGYDLAALDKGDLAVEVDTRSLYASALHWLGGPVDEVLGGGHSPVGLA